MPLNEDNQDQYAFEERPFEEHLKRLRPVTPRALFIPRQSTASWHWPMLASTAVVAAAIALLLAPKLSLYKRTAPQKSSVVLPPEDHVPITLGQLNSALRAGDQNLEQLLRTASPALLPHERRGTALYELSKE